MYSLRRRKYNNPSAFYIIADSVLAFLVFYLLIGILPFTHSEPSHKYFIPFLLFQAGRIFFGVAFKKYLDCRKRELKQVVRSMFRVDTVVSLISIVAILFVPNTHYSVFFPIALSIIVFVVEVSLISIYFAFHDAEVQDGEVPVFRKIAEEPNAQREIHPVDDEVREYMSQYILSHRGEELIPFLQENADLFLSSSLLINTTERFNIEKVSKRRYTNIINLHIINDIREINSFFATISERLPYGGQFTGCFELLQQRKQRIIGSKRKFWGYLAYLKDFSVYRLMPKLNLTRELYFWITAGKGRALSKAEVFGRIYFSGFEIVEEAEINGLFYFIARKVKEPLTTEDVNYSVVLGLRRVGKNSELFKVYKLRTMYPYSSYLQGYVYDKNHLDEGGKFNQDFRISTLGGFMRRYWLDELPMLGNLLKGDMKLVGVRPLSKQYFSLYTKELQQQRVQHKPGLLPPFYADMPKTLDEIQASEKKYLDECERKGTFVTDLRYLCIILFNILFKKARSK